MERHSPANPGEQRTEQDNLVRKNRESFRNSVRGLVPRIILEDGYFQDALSGLNSEQKETFFNAAEEAASVMKFGRAGSEKPRISRKRMGAKGTAIVDPIVDNEIALALGNRSRVVLIDPIIDRWEANFRKAHIDDANGYLSMLSNAANAIVRAYEVDPQIV